MLGANLGLLLYGEVSVMLIKFNYLKQNNRECFGFNILDYVNKRYFEQFDPHHKGSSVLYVT